MLRFVTLTTTLWLCGCASTPPAADTPRPMNAEEVARYLEKADSLHDEPRTPGRLMESLELSVAAAEGSEKGAPGKLEALWRGARACTWLARNHPDSGLQVDFALQGIALGKEALALEPTTPEVDYYQALNLGILSQLTGRGLFRIATMKTHAARVIDLDPEFAYAGGHRFLGVLCYRTCRIPLVAAGTAEEGHQHLQRAYELFPRHGENQLDLARYYVWSGEIEKARQLLAELASSSAPPGLSAEHAAWLAAGKALEEELAAQTRSQ